MACFKLSLLEYLFSVTTEKRSEILDSASPHTLLSSLSYPRRKQQLLKLTEWLSPSVRHTNTAGKNRPPVFSRTSVCNLGAKLSLTSIDEHICTGFKPQHIFLQSIAKTWPLPAQLTIAAQTIALYLLNCRRLLLTIQELFSRSHRLGPLQWACYTLWLSLLILRQVVAYKFFLNKPSKSWNNWFLSFVC